MPDLKAALSDAFVEHRWNTRPTLMGEYPQCSCGVSFRYRSDHADHLADVLLALPGVAVIQLPKPDWRKPANDDENGATAWGYPDGEIVVYETGDYEWRSFGINNDDPSRLRDGAAALLAAAVLSKGEAR